MPGTGVPFVLYTYVVASALLVALQVADLGTTLAALQIGGHEINPLVAWTLQNAGVVGLLYVKILGCVALLAFLVAGRRLRALRIANTLSLAVVAINVMQLAVF